MRAEPPRPPTRSAPLVVALRIALVAIAAGAVVGAMLIRRGGSALAERRFACPMHSEVTASHPGDCPICGMALEELDAAHHVAMPGDPAASGAQDIALTALRASDEARRLLRFSVAPARRNVLPGEVFAPAIVEADGSITARLYRDELATLAPDERAEFVPSAAPDAPTQVERDTAAPVLHPPLADVRFRFRPRPGSGSGGVAGAGAPPPGQVGWVRLAYRTRDMLVVRTSSVIQSTDGPYVLVFSAQKGTLAKRKVELGKEWEGMTAIVGGVRDKEFVVMGDAFSFDAERRLQAAP
jgi:multidrug efflux pump subunit AcrA (membrane-fusion protein)